jgi:methionyl-tRNA formyltransferase
MLFPLAKLKVVFMGTPDFAVPVLNYLIKSTKLLAVVTQPDKKAGRKQKIAQSPIKQLALANKIKVLQPAKVRDNAEFIQQIKQLQPDLIVVVAYGFILPKEILDIPKYGIINIHASLLPKYRGASPIQSAILNGDQETGVTLMLIDEQMDHGPFLGQKSLSIDNDSYKTLHDKLAKLGTELLVEILPKYIAGQIKPVVQDDSLATYCYILTKADGKIDWTKSAQEIERQVRAFTPWPGTWTTWQGKNLKILAASLSLDNVKAEVGEVIKVDDGLAVQCGQGLLQITELQIEGKKVMNAKEFLNGYSQIIGTKLA